MRGGESVQSLPAEHLISQFRHHLGRFALSNPSIAERQRPPPPSSTQSPAAHRHRTLSHSPLGPLRQGTPVISMKWEQNSLHNGMRRVSCAAATNEQSRPRRAVKAPWFCLFSIGRGDVRVTRLLQPCYLLGATPSPCAVDKRASGAEGGVVAPRRRGRARSQRSSFPCGFNASIIGHRLAPSSIAKAIACVWLREDRKVVVLVRFDEALPSVEQFIRSCI